MKRYCEKKDFRKLYEDLVKSDWFKKAYNNKSLGECPFDFPELHESEDERIRKSLIEFLTDIKEISESGRTTWAVRKEDAEMCKSFLDYLENQKEVGIQWFKSDNVKNPDKPYIDKAGMFYTTDGRMCYASKIEKQKEQKPAECHKDALIEWAKHALKCQEEELAKYDGPCYGKASTMGRIDAYKVLISKLNSL